jgi:hypothetical protein
VHFQEDLQALDWIWVLPAAAPSLKCASHQARVTRPVRHCPRWALKAGDGRRRAGHGPDGTVHDGLSIFSVSKQ